MRGICQKLVFELICQTMEESATQGEGVLATVHHQGAKFNGVICDPLFAMLEPHECSGHLPARSGLIKKILERVSLKLSNKLHTG